MALPGWLRDKAKLHGAGSSLEDCGQVRKRSRLAEDQQLENTVLTWFNQAWFEGMSISGSVTQTQAEKSIRNCMAPRLNLMPQTNGLVGLKTVAQVTIRVKQRSGDEAAADVYPVGLRKLIEVHELSAEPIYNCEDTLGLNSSQTSRRLLGSSKLMIQLCCNKEGMHKLAPLVIGKFGEPRCFHHVNMNSLPALYMHSFNAWMTSVISEDWFHEEIVPSIRKYLHLTKCLHEYLRKLNLKEALNPFGTSWNEVVQNMIFGFWRKGLGPAVEMDGEDSSDSNDFYGFSKTEAATTEEEDEEDETLMYEPLQAISEVLRSLGTVMRWIETSKRGTLSRVMQVSNIMHDTRADAREKVVQRTLKDFFIRGGMNDD
ncbi:tigger transposable element derived 5-like [Mercenaria mercenaria]|uniref:tigger transposable element derived 5-like n=1 Tax=Mercenaria mercenaria TaxID=6596 RepID=UPI00234F6BF9|nr:tigger transposable element derived 5-like [Mercenaria mercenaria]